MEVISRIFAPSPFELMRHYAVNVQACLQRLPSLWQAALAGDAKEQARLRNEIATIGSQVALVASDLRDDVSRSRLLPVRREDLIALIESESAMVESCQRVAATLGDRCFFLPEAIGDPMDRFATQTFSMATLSTELIGQLIRLAEWAFGGPQRIRTLALVEEIHDRNSECERLGSMVAQEVDSLHGVMQPAARSSVLRLTSQLEQLAEDVSGAAQQLRALITPTHSLSRFVKRRFGLRRFCPEEGRSGKLRSIVGSGGGGKCPA